MSASRPTRPTPFETRRSVAGTLDANRFYTVQERPMPPKQSLNFRQGENPFTAKPKRVRPGSLHHRHRAKSTQQFKRLSMLSLFLICLSIGMWMLGGMVVNAIEERFRSPKPQQEIVLETPLISPEAQISSQGVSVLGIPHQQQWNSSTPLSPLIRPTLMDSQRHQALQEIVDRLSAGIEPTLRPHVFVLDGQTLQFAGKRIEETVSSASVIKLPLLYLYALHLNSGTLNNNTPAFFDKHHMVSGSGDWQFLGTQKFYTAFQTAEAMIQNSDNSATELMTSLLGGKNEVNQQLKDLGLQQTALRNTLPDTEGYNTISVYDMVTLMLNLKEHPVFSMETKATAMEILEGTHNRRLIPALLPAETLVAHKTGDIGKSLGETALVYLPDGRYYYLSVMVERPHNHGAAKDYIQHLSKGIWDYYEAQKSFPSLNHRSQSTDHTSGASLPAASPEAEIF